MSLIETYTYSCEYDRHVTSEHKSNTETSSAHYETLGYTTAIVQYKVV